jgi:hypothetical protein
MKKLVVKINPFQKKQQIYVYDSEQKVIPSVETDIENLNFTISNLAQTEGITRVDFAGPKKFTEGMKAQLEDIQITLYKKNNLEINLI